MLDKFKNIADIINDINFAIEVKENEIRLSDIDLDNYLEDYLNR